MSKLELDWNCDGMGNIKILDKEKYIFKKEISHRDRSYLDVPLISNTIKNDRYKKKTYHTKLKTPLSCDNLWTETWERVLNEKELKDLDLHYRFL